MSQPLTIAPYASAYVNTSELFPTGTFTGSATVTSDRPLAAAELTLFLKDVASLRALTATEAGMSQLLPNVTRRVKNDGSLGMWNELYVRNEGVTATDITVEYFARDGVSKLTVTHDAVPPHGLAIFNTHDQAFKKLGKRFIGWVRITSSAAPVASDALVVRSKGKQLGGVNGVNETVATGRTRCADVQYTSSSVSSLYVLNADPTKAAQVQARIYDQAKGQQMGEFVINVPANGQYALTPPKGPMGAIRLNFRGALTLSPQGDGSKTILALIKTQALNGKRKVISQAVYMCR